jgi:hypothetical protein
MAAQEDPRGFPVLDRDEMTLDELPPRPSPLQLAQFYASIVALWYRQWPRVVDALHWLRDTHARAHVAHEENRDAVISEIRELREQLVRTGQMRKPLPSLSNLGAEITHNGTVRLPPEAFEAIQTKLAELEAKATAAENQEKLEKARAEGATAALATVTQAAAARNALFWRWLPIALTVLGLVGAFVGWLLTHVFKL